MKAILALSFVILVASWLPASASANILYQATMLDGRRPANGTYDLKFTLYENSSGGVPLGIAFTNINVRITNGVVQSGLFCKNDSLRLKHGWVEAAVRRAGSDMEFIPMRAQVDQCKKHSTGAGKACDHRCEYVTLRLHTFRLPFPFDIALPRRGRGFLHLPPDLAGARPSPNASKLP